MAGYESDFEFGDSWWDNLLEAGAEWAVDEAVDMANDFFNDLLGIGPDTFGGQPFDKIGIPSPYWDPHMAANMKGQLLYIQHLGSKKAVGLFAALTTFSNNYSVTWSQQPVYGRADPIATYQNTSRSLNIGFKLTAANIFEAAFNFSKTLGRGGKDLVSLSNMMYPTYHQIGNYRTIAQPPLMAIRHMQLIQSYGDAAEGGFLPGYFRSCNIIPDYESGGFEHTELYNNFIYPKVININMQFEVLHDYILGWEAATGTIAELFPEIGTGEDFGRELGEKYGGPWGGVVGGIVGGIVDEVLDDDEDGYDAGDALDDFNEVVDAVLESDLNPLKGLF